jgi:competence protein ComEC
VIVLGAAGYLSYRFVLPWWRAKPPAPSGGQLQVHVLDVGPVEGDSILIISPTGKSVLIDAGDAGKGKVVLESLKRQSVQQLDYFIATHPHPDHLGGADEVLKAIKVMNVIDNGLEPVGFVKPAAPSKSAGTQPKKQPAKTAARPVSVTRFYEEYRVAVDQSGARYEKVQAGKTFDLGGGARLTVLAPSEPMFTREQMKSGGNEPNANSIVVRLDYGAFSMLLPGDAEEQTEHRLLTKDVNTSARILKVAHHGSLYATSEEFVKRVKPQVAIISCGAWNRYGHPAQAVLDRLQAAGVKLYRTDLQGEITITTRGKENDYVIKPAKEVTDNLWVGRVAQKDDSTRAGFIAYGDFGPPPKNVNRK